MQPASPSPAVPGGELPTLNDPAAGDTASPPELALAVQDPTVYPSSAGATPRVIVLARPTWTAVPPLGSEYPTAGSRPAPYDGGLSAGSEAHRGSGVDESPKVNFPPVVMIDDGSQGWFQVVDPVGEAPTPDAQVGVALATCAPTRLREWM